MEHDNIIPVKKVLFFLIFLVIEGTLCVKFVAEQYKSAIVLLASHHPLQFKALNYMQKTNFYTLR